MIGESSEVKKNVRDKPIYLLVGDRYDRSNIFWYVIQDRTKGEHEEEIRHKKKIINQIHGHDDDDDYYYDSDDRNNINETHILVVKQSETDVIRKLRLPAPNPSLNLLQATLIVFNSRIYLLGGKIAENGPSRMVIYLDITHSEKGWLKGPSLLAPREMLSAVALDDSGFFFAFGDTDGGVEPFAEFLEPKLSWGPVPLIPEPERSQIQNAQLLAVSGTKIFIYTTGEFCFGLTFDFQNYKWNIFDRSFCGVWHRGVVLDFCSNSYLFVFGLHSYEYWLKSKQPKHTEQLSVYDLNMRTWLPLPIHGLVEDGTVLPAPDTGLTDSFLFQMNQKNKLAFVWSKPFYASSEPLLFYTEIHCTKFVIRCTSGSDSKHPDFSAQIVSYGSYHVKGGASVYDCAVPVIGEDKEEYGLPEELTEKIIL